MAEKRSSEVVIAGEVYKIAGNESEEHMKRVVRFLNEKAAQTQYRPWLRTRIIRIITTK